MAAMVTSLLASSPIIASAKQAERVTLPSSRRSAAAALTWLRPSPPAVACLSDSAESDSQTSAAPTSRRAALLLSAAVAAAAATRFSRSPEETAAWAAVLPAQDDSTLRLCTGTCEEELEKVPITTTSSGLQYRDIVEGTGPTPIVGFQVATNYVAMLPNGRVFGSSLEKGIPNIFRVGSGQVIPGLDEGLLTMKAGGKRRLYIPGELAFPKGLTAAAGRPRVPPNSPVTFDVELLYIPGLSEVDVE